MLAILCSGQGQQGPRTFAVTGEPSAASPLFRRAAALLGGDDPRELVRRAPDAALHHDRTGQILCALQALAAAASFADAWPRRRVVAGYSVGEMAAWSIAGPLAAEGVLDLVARRAELMDAASRPGDGLLFVRGLARAAIETLCARHAAAIAIVEPGDAWVVGGSGDALDALTPAARAAGAIHIVRLGVEVAAHTPRLAAAATAFRTCLEQVPNVGGVAPATRLLSGVDAAAVFDVRAGLGKLAAQVSRTVEWGRCLDACVEAGAVAFFELGPGRALAEMAARAHPQIPARSVEDFRTPAGVRAWLHRVAR